MLEIAAAVRARDTIISFEELHDKLVEYESYLKREEIRNNSNTLTANTARFPQTKNGYLGKNNNQQNGGNQYPFNNQGQR
ncbi:hypothetical protein Dsin_018791 [Dipteronia sinensis]|uniref:Uncharacterized protein n=1 Tax=Dipteronia sinensis TaxID=43782 RepID=A0AAE0E253_9ROSI|nr:hypothetical protein Dsin_018791 [Dipteronia sinensis]